MVGGSTPTWDPARQQLEPQERWVILYGIIAAQYSTNLTFLEPVNNGYLLTEIAQGG